MLTQLHFRGRVLLIPALFAVTGVSSGARPDGQPDRRRVFTAMGCGLLLALLALPNLVNGQGANATLLGTVTDVSGAVVPNAAVQVTNVATGVKQTGTSDSKSRYTGV